MNYTIIERPDIIMAGIACRTSNDPGRAINDIPLLWERFSNEQIASKIPYKTSDEVFALYCDYEGDHTQPYSVVIGCPVSKIDTLPAGFVAKKIPGGTYALYKAIGEHPKTLIETWGGIWQTDLNRTYTGDYELYNEKFTAQTPPEIEIYIAINH